MCSTSFLLYATQIQPLDMIWRCCALETRIAVAKHDMEQNTNFAFGELGFEAWRVTWIGSIASRISVNGRMQRVCEVVLCPLQQAMSVGVLGAADSQIRARISYGKESGCCIVGLVW